MMNNYYKILEIDENATSADIKKAYRKLAHEYHPDKNESPSAIEKFREINEAYGILSGPNKEYYDKNLNNYFDESYINDYFAKHADSFFYKDNFNINKGKDINLNVFLSVSDVVNGCTRSLNISNTDQETIEIKKGARDNQTIIFKEQGEKHSLQNGDLKITIIHIKDSLYKIINMDIHVNVNVDVYTAVLGGNINLNTIIGGLIVEVPPGTQCADKLRVKGKGIPVYEKTSTVGDLILTINVVLPIDLSEEEIVLFNKLKDIRKDENS